MVAGPPPSAGLADANQLLVRLCNVTDEQLVPPPGVTFDRCLEELLLAQYGLSVVRHGDVTHDEQHLLPNPEKHSLFVGTPRYAHFWLVFLTISGSYLCLVFLLVGGWTDSVGPVRFGVECLPSFVLGFAVGGGLTLVGYVRACAALCLLLKVPVASRAELLPYVAVQYES